MFRCFLQQKEDTIKIVSMFDDRQLNWLSVSMILEERSSSGGRIYIVPGGEKPFLLSYFHSSSRHRCLSYPRFRSFPISLEREGEGERRRLGVIWRNNGVDKLDLRGSPEERGRERLKYECPPSVSMGTAVHQLSTRTSSSSPFSLAFALHFPVSPVSSSFSFFPTPSRPSILPSYLLEENRSRNPRGEWEISPSKRVKFEKFNSISAPSIVRATRYDDKWREWRYIYIYGVYRRGKKRFFYLAVRRESGHKGLKG